MTTPGASNSSNDILLSDLPLHLFDKLLSHSRSSANPTVDAATLQKDILTKLNNNNNHQKITKVRDLLRTPPTSLLNICDPCLTYVECNRLLSRIHHECSAQPISALGIIRRNQIICEHIPTGLHTLDACLQGGLPIGSITEVVGRAGAGKTHLAQQLTILATKENGGSIFIDAEKKLSLLRLREIAFERNNLSDASYNEQQKHAHDMAQQVLENVTIHELLTTRELLDKLDLLENEIILRNSKAATYEKQKQQQQQKEEESEDAVANISTRRASLPVRLIVIDSIAAPIKRDFDMMGSSSNTAAQRASAIFQIAKKLKQLAYDYQLAIVVINQVGSGGGTSRGSRNNTLDMRDGEFTGSLGTAWQHCVTTRIVLEHEADPHRLHAQQEQQQQYSDGAAAPNLPIHTTSTRTVMLTKSLVSKRTQLTFELNKQGLCEVSVTE